MTDILMEAPSSHRNMKWGLILFGAFSVFLGVICLSMIPMMFFGVMIEVKGRPQTPFNMILPGVFIYLFIGVVDIWLGVGSLFCKRWARSLMSIWSLFWLAGGLMGVAGFFFVVDSMDAAFAQSGAKVSENFLFYLKLLMGLFLGVIYVVIPVSFSWFYLLRDTRLTCEQRHPEKSWTDRCPAPVLAVSVVTVLFGTMFPVILFYAPIFPLFGFYLTGWPAVLWVLLLSGLLSWTGYGLYRLKPLAWGTGLGLILFVMTSYMVTFFSTGVMEFYYQMKLPEETTKMIETMPFVHNRWIGLLGLLYLGPYVGLMIYIRKHFRGSERS